MFFFHNWGLYDEALSEFQKAIDILEPVFGMK
jgi:hypothetical protein